MALQVLSGDAFHAKLARSETNLLGRDLGLGNSRFHFFVSRGISEIALGIPLLGGLLFQSIQLAQQLFVVQNLYKNTFKIRQKSLKM